MSITYVIWNSCLVYLINKQMPTVHYEVNIRNSSISKMFDQVPIVIFITSKVTLVWPLNRFQSLEYVSRYQANYYIR